MAITGASLKEDSISELLASGVKNRISQFMQMKLEAELVPVLRKQITEHIEKVLKDFATHKLSLSTDHTTQAVMINIQFAEKKEN
jgi:hypothetical protein